MDNQTMLAIALIVALAIVFASLAAVFFNYLVSQLDNQSDADDYDKHNWKYHHMYDTYRSRRRNRRHYR